MQRALTRIRIRWMNKNMNAKLKFCNYNYLSALTYESAKPERPQRHIDDGAGDVDEPVWEEWCDSKEDNIEEQVVSLFVHLQHKSTESYSILPG